MLQSIYVCIFVVVWSLAAAISDIPNTEMQALENFYVATNGDEWTCCSHGTIAWNFTDGSNPCSDNWLGVSCGVESTQYHINGLSLSGYNVNGTIPSSISNLDYLIDLDMIDNYLHDALPSSLYTISTLQSVLLSKNKICGSLPNTMAALEALITFEVDGNSLTGSIPTVIGDMSELSHLDVSQNYMTGSLPASLGKLRKLEDLNVEYNSLTGSIPTSLNAPKLLSIDITHNNITGVVPSELSSCHGLTKLYLRNNGLFGTLPNEIGNLTNLRSFDLSNNFFTGTVPAAIFQFTRLQQLSLAANTFSGTLPNTIDQAVDLGTLNIPENCFTGTIPSTIGALTGMIGLTLRENYFNGTIPTSIGQMTGIINIELSQNYLTGTIPSSLGNFTKVLLWSVEKNMLNGSIPAGFGVVMEKVIEFEFSSNSITGNLPTSLVGMSKVASITGELNYLSGPFPSVLCELPKLEGIYLDKNSMTGSLPTCLGISTKLKSVFVASNALTGSIPSNLFNITRLANVALSFNEITGTIPTEFGDLPLLVDLYLQSNRLTGTLPSEFGQCSYIKNFYVSDNLLSGALPTSLGLIRGVEYFDISSNFFSGSLPTSLSQLSQIVQLVVQSNKLSGSLAGVFNVSGQLLFENIQIFENRLTGTIPSEIFLLPSLNTFVGTSNCFHGSLPDTICSCVNLVTLILDGLSSSTACRSNLLGGLSSSYVLTTSVGGEIPECVYRLPTLLALHLSGNEFTGSLPDTLATPLQDLSLAHNSLKGDIGLSFMDRYWASLDLSYNRLSGTLDSSARERSDNSTLYLENNRLSGKIPEAYLPLLDVSLLGSNIFTCDLSNVDISLPANDPNKDNYHCGSALFNMQYYGWLALMIIAIVLCSVGYYGWGWLVPSLRHFLVVCLDHFRSWKKVSNRNEEHGHVFISDFGEILDSLLYVAIYFTAFIVFIFLPLYLTLSYYFGTYTYAYAYVASAAFLSGTVPFGLEFALWTCFIIFVNFFFSEYVVEAVRGNELERVKRILEDKATAISSQDRMFIIILYVGVNVIIVGGVNAVYVYLAIYGNGEFLLLEQIMLSFFKVIWNRVCTPRCLRLIGSFITPTLVYTRWYELQLIDVEMAVMMMNNIVIPIVLSAVVSPYCFYNVFVSPPVVTSSFVTPICIFTSGLGCLISVPLLQTTSYHPPFAYSYQCSSSIISYYSPTFVSFCIIYTFLVPIGTFLLLQLYKFSRRFPKSCLFQFADTFLPQILRPINISEKESHSLKNEEHYTDVNENNDSHDASSSKDGDERSGENDMMHSQNTWLGYRTIFNPNRLVSTIFTNLALLLTFGVMFPPLALALLVTIFVIVYGAKLQLGRFFGEALAKGKVSYIKVIERECQGVGASSSLRSSIWMVLTISCLFYSLFLLDTLGDAVGFQKAFWVLIVMPLLPLCLYLSRIVHAVVLATCAHSPNQHTSVELSGPSTGLFGVSGPSTGSGVCENASNNGDAVLNELQRRI